MDDHDWALAIGLDPGASEGSDGVLLPSRTSKSALQIVTADTRLIGNHRTNHDGIFRSPSDGYSLSLTGCYRQRVLWQEVRCTSSRHSPR